MKEQNKNKIAALLWYVFICLQGLLVLLIVFGLGEVKGMTDAHKEQLKEQIRLLEQEKTESMKQQIKQEQI